jgi:hypothetical protein
MFGFTSAANPKSTPIKDSSGSDAAADSSASSAATSERGESEERNANVWLVDVLFSGACFPRSRALTLTQRIGPSHWLTRRISIECEAGSSDSVSAQDVIDACTTSLQPCIVAGRRRASVVFAAGHVHCAQRSHAARGASSHSPRNASRAVAVAGAPVTAHGE